jgi:hypothetical protein
MTVAAGLKIRLLAVGDVRKAARVISGRLAF